MTEHRNEPLKYVDPMPCLCCAASFECGVGLKLCSVIDCEGGLVCCNGRGR